MYIGVDLGSTNIKAAIYNKNFELIDRQSRPVEYIRENGFVEFDAWAYYQELAGLLADMLKQSGVTHVEEVAFTGQAETLVVLGADGKPLMNAVSSMDERSVQECKVLAEKFDAATCEAVHALNPDIKVMVGGAPITQDYANQIGAQGYSTNAAAAAVLAKELVG